MIKICAHFFIIGGIFGANPGEILWANNEFDNMRIIIIVSAVLFFHGIKYILNCLKKQGGGSPQSNKKEEKPMIKNYRLSFASTCNVIESVQGIPYQGEKEQ